MKPQNYSVTKQDSEMLHVQMPKSPYAVFIRITNPNKKQAIAITIDPATAWFTVRRPIKLLYVLNQLDR